jgi:hypothetical protein
VEQGSGNRSDAWCDNVFAARREESASDKGFVPAGVDYCVGAHLAEVLGRETFNLYGSLKRRHMVVQQGDRALVDVLVARGTVYPGTTSVTLVRFDQNVVDFVDDVLAKRAKKKRKGADEALQLFVRALESEGAI